MGLAAAIEARWAAPSGQAPVTLLDEAGPRPLSGARLLELAATWAGHLAGAGVAAGDRVGLVLPTGEDFLGAFFGGWRLGAA
ncbi:MAG: AMP-dependent synthetase, partial [Candidatus Sericytochromatia bacterium]|nr:AMP-dependent synthetase [Candidatus Tanganyikabacteria bacterium]